jgi:hypothetical protein
MNCNCQWTEIVIAIVILLFAFWDTSVSQWVIAIGAVLLLVHALSCKNCKACAAPAEMPKKKRSRRR